VNAAAEAPTDLVELSGVRLNVAGLDAEVRGAILDGSYEAPELRALASALRADDVVLELGTGLGLLSSWCAQRIGSARVHTFEANPALEPRIRETFALNGVAPALGVAMLGEHAGEHDFHVHEAFWASSATDATGAAHTVRVPVRPLNDEIRRIGPSLLVMDIEGGEDAALRGMEATLRRAAPDLLLEVHPEQLGELGTSQEALIAWIRDLAPYELVTLDHRRGAVALGVLPTAGSWHLLARHRERPQPRVEPATEIPLSP